MSCCVCEKPVADVVVAVCDGCLRASGNEELADAVKAA
jgi:hypothetical protein